MASHTLQSWRIFQSWQKFGRGTNFAWQNSEAVVPNRLILVKFVFGYEVPKTCVRRVEKEGVVLSNEQSDTSRTRIKGIFSRSLGAVVLSNEQGEQSKIRRKWQEY